MIAEATVLPSDRLRILHMAATDGCTVEMNKAAIGCLLSEIDALKKARIIPDDLRRECVESGTLAGQKLFQERVDKFAARHGEALHRAKEAEGIVSGWWGYVLALGMASWCYSFVEHVARSMIAVLQ